MSNRIIVKKNLLDGNMSGDSISVLVGLCKISNNTLRKTYTSYSILEKVITGSIGNRTTQKHIQLGLDELKERNIIDYYEEDKVLFIDTEKLYRKEKETYICINDNEFMKIMSIPKIQNSNLLKYYIFLIGTINNVSKSGYTTQETFEIKLSIPRIRIIEYNKILEGLKFIYIYRVDTAIKNLDGTIRKVSNTYGKYEDKELIINSATEYITTVNTTIKLCENPMTGDRKRSIKQKYNSMIKKINKGFVPSDVEIEEVNLLVDEYNIATQRSEYYEVLTPIKINV